MFSSHLISWERIVPRKRKDSTVLTGESPRVMGVSGAVFFLKSTTISTVSVYGLGNESAGLKMIPLSD